MVRVGDYNLGETIGRGTYSQVKIARNTKTERDYVAKIVSRNTGTTVDRDVKREIFILRKVRHENVVGLKEILVSENNYYIILERVSGCDLCELLIRRYPDGMPRAETHRLFGQLVSGVAQCHGVGVAHRDLKPENLLITEGLHLKISDFGLSRLHRQSQHAACANEMSETVTGTLAYLAPEMLQGPYDAFKADMWSLGCILYTMVTGSFPFGSAMGPALEDRILNTHPDPLPATVDEDIADLINRLLIKEPDHRVTLPEVAGHPFVAGDSLEHEHFAEARSECSPKHTPSSAAPNTPTPMRQSSCTPGEAMLDESSASPTEEDVLRAVDVGDLENRSFDLGSVPRNSQRSGIRRRLEELDDDSDGIADDES